MREEFEAIRDEFATPRRSTIAPAADGIEDEDLIEHEDMVVTVTLQGYINRTSLDSFRAQARGGKGRAGMTTQDEDAATNLFVTGTRLEERRLVEKGFSRSRSGASRNNKKKKKT